METPLKFHYPLPQPQPPSYNYRSPPPPPPPNHRHHQNLQQQRQQHGGPRLAMRHLTFQRISANRFIVPLNRSHLPQIFSLHRTTMSDQTKEKSQSVDASQSTLNILDGKQEPEKSEPIPPPPEKPLPGDCCGSGCVRCVWDVYYDELEEYNNLYKSKSEAIVNPKPS